MPTITPWVVKSPRCRWSSAGRCARAWPGRSARRGGSQPCPARYTRRRCDQSVAASTRYAQRWSPVEQVLLASRPRHVGAERTSEQRRARHCTGRRTAVGRLADRAVVLDRSEVAAVVVHLGEVALGGAQVGQAAARARRDRSAPASECTLYAASLPLGAGARSPGRAPRSPKRRTDRPDEVDGQSPCRSGKGVAQRRAPAASAPVGARGRSARRIERLTSRPSSSASRCWRTAVSVSRTRRRGRCAVADSTRFSRSTMRRLASDSSAATSAIRPAAYRFREADTLRNPMRIARQRGSGFDKMSTMTQCTIDAEQTAIALENQFGLADRVVDDAALANSVDRFREQGITLPTFAAAGRSVDASTRPSSATPTRTAPTPRNLWRVHWYNDLAGGRVDVPDHVVLPTQPHRRRQPDHRRVRRPLPDDHRPQGARRLRLPGAAGRHRPVRPDPPPGDLAVDRQLRPRRHRHQPDHGQPRAWRSCPRA